MIINMKINVYRFPGIIAAVHKVKGHYERM